MVRVQVINIEGESDEVHDALVLITGRQAVEQPVLPTPEEPPPTSRPTPTAKPKSQAKGSRICANCKAGFASKIHRENCKAGLPKA